MVSSSDTSSLIAVALREDIGAGDVTSQLLIPAAARATAHIVAKAAGVIAGTGSMVQVFATVSRAIRCRIRTADGGRVRPGQVIADLAGPARAILTAERTALNLLQHLSGVATLTAHYVRAVRGTRAKILDTRKTLPGLRQLEKAAVAAGGGTNHRMGLDDAVLIKTNHLRLLDGDVRLAITLARRGARHLPIEVEVATWTDFLAAIEAKPDVVMLDNWTLSAIRRAVAHAATRRSRPLVEVSGGVTFTNVRTIAKTGVDRISVGRLTHSAPALDFALRVGP